MEYQQFEGSFPDTGVEIDVIADFDHVPSTFSGRQKVAFFTNPTTGEVKIWMNDKTIVVDREEFLKAAFWVSENG